MFLEGWWFWHTWCMFVHAFICVHVYICTNILKISVGFEPPFPLMLCQREETDKKPSRIKKQKQDLAVHALGIRHIKEETVQAVQPVSSCEVWAVLYMCTIIHKVTKWAQCLWLVIRYEPIITARNATQQCSIRKELCFYRELKLTTRSSLTKHRTLVTPQKKNYFVNIFVGGNWNQVKRSNYWTCSFFLFCYVWPYFIYKPMGSHWKLVLIIYEALLYGVQEMLRAYRFLRGPLKTSL